jgi:hypothetical protein
MMAKPKLFTNMTLEEKVADLRQSASMDERLSDVYQQRSDSADNPRMKEFYAERMAEYLHRADAWNALADEYERKGGES